MKIDFIEDEFTKMAFKSQTSEKSIIFDNDEVKILKSALNILIKAIQLQSKNGIKGNDFDIAAYGLRDILKTYGG